MLLPIYWLFANRQATCRKPTAGPVSSGLLSGTGLYFIFSDFLRLLWELQKTNVKRRVLKNVCLPDPASSRSGSHGRSIWRQPSCPVLPACVWPSVLRGMQERFPSGEKYFYSSLLGEVQLFLDSCVSLPLPLGSRPLPSSLCSCSDRQEKSFYITLSSRQSVSTGIV